MTARDEAVEAAAKALWRVWNGDQPKWQATNDATRNEGRAVARQALDAALPVLLDGLDRDAIIDRLAWHDEHCGPLTPEQSADAVLAYLRDELGGAS